MRVAHRVDGFPGNAQQEVHALLVDDPDGLHGLGEEADHAVFPHGHAERGEFVDDRIVRVDAAGVIAGMVARLAVPGHLLEDGRDRIPAGIGGGQRRRAPRRLRGRGQALEAADEVHELEEIGVAVPALHRLDVAAVLDVVFVLEPDPVGHPVQIVRLARQERNEPFVPLADEGKGNVLPLLRKRPVDLLLEEKAVMHGVRARVAMAVMPAAPLNRRAPVAFRTAEVRSGLPLPAARHVQRDVRRAEGEGDHLALPVRRNRHVLLRHAGPVPRVRHGRRAPRRTPEGEAVLQRLGIRTVGMRHDQGLAVPFEPQVAEPSLRVVVVPHVPHVRGAASAPRRRHVVEELRRLVALVVELLQDGEQLLRHLAVVVAVRRVEVEHVNARVDEHLHVPPQHPFVRREVIAEQRFAPVEHRRARGIRPQRRIRLLHHLGVDRLHLRDVVRALRAVLSVPEVVEQTHLPSLFAARLGGGDEFAPQMVASRIVRKVRP